MPTDILQKLNWVDILLVVLAIRIIYVAVQTGFVIELMKLLATVFSLFIALHYYTALSGLIKNSPMTVGTLNVMAFVVLWAVTFFICKLTRDGLFMLFTIQALSDIDKWGAGILAVGRVILTASLLLFLFLVSDHAYLQSTTMKSLSHKYVIQVAPRIYAGMCDRFVAKLFANEKKNPAVLEVMKGVPKQ